MNCTGKIEVITYKGYVSHGICDTCLRRIVLPQIKVELFESSTLKCSNNLLSDDEKLEIIRIYIAFRNHAITLYKNNKLKGSVFEKFGYEEIKDIRLMNYKDNYKDIVKNYKMKWIFEGSNGTKVLVYEEI